MSTEAKVILTGDETPLRSALMRARDNVNQFGEDAAKPFTALRDAVGNLGNILMGVGAVRLTQLADDAALIQARLKDVAGNFADAQIAQQQLYASSQRLQVSYQDLAGSYSKMLPAVKEMGGGAKEAVKLAEILATSARLSGASTEEASASAQQFAQALQSGVLQGDELKSILENNGTLARSLAEGLGVTVGELKNMGSEGKLTSDKVATALLGQYDKIKERSAELPQTVGGAFTQLTNSFQQFVASANEGTGVFAGVASVLSGIAKLADAVRATFASTGSEADKLGRNNSIKQWGETVGAIFAYVIDLGRAIGEVFTIAGKQLGALAASAAAAMNGDFKEAGSVLREYEADFTASWNRIKSLVSGGEGSTLRNYALGGGREEPMDLSGPNASLKSTAKGKDKKKGAGSGDKSQMGMFDAALEEQKALLEEQGKLLDQAKQYELNYWQQVLESAKLGENDKLQIKKKVAQLRLEVARQEAKDETEATKDNLETWKQVELLKIDGQRIAAKTMLDQDQINKKQLLDKEIEFEEARYQVMVEYLRRRAALSPNDRNGQDKLLNDLTVEGMTRDNKVADLSGQKAKLGKGMDFDGMFDGLGKSASSAFSQILTGAKSMQSAMLQVFTSIRDSFLNLVITQPLQAQIASFAKLLAAKMGFVTQQQALDATATATTVSLKQGETAAVASANAVQAGTGAAASQAPIPIVGPALALGAMAAIFAAVSAMGGKMKSARNGYDIPAGLNPLVQLHEEEMVLPKAQANAVRDMASGGGGGGSQVVNIRAMDAKGVAQALRRGGALEKSLRSLNRDFVKVR